MTRRLFPVLLLFAAGCTTISPLGKASLTGDVQQVRSLLDKGADLNRGKKYKPTWDSPATYMSPMRLAIEAGHADVVRLLLEKGASVDQNTTDSRTPLGYAVAKGDMTIVKLLLEKGADINATGSDGTPSLTFADTVEMAELLLARGADVNKFGARANDFAVVVGISNYSDLPEARFAERDANAVAAHMEALGIPRRNIIHLAGAKAGRSALVKYLNSWLPKNVKPSSRVYFYFSGHGAPDPSTGEAYLVPWDGDPNFLADTAYPIKRLYSRLNSLKAKEVLVALDACFSGAGGRSVLAQGARPLITKVDMGEAPAGKLTLLTASSGSQITTTLENQGHGIFTYFFLKGLNGEAQDGRGRITATGLFNYLKPKVQDEARRQNRDQAPTFHTSSDLIIRSR